ncbi:type II restriction endonuclease [Candidatus Woesearchaeota archaeon]|nr:type II restriction endonuclease [Candidatus Woesearchaeota archaeon]
MSKQEEARALGSSTAKGGFRNEDDIVLKFNRWEEDKEARDWLNVMGYNLNEIENVTAIKLSGYKTDVQVQVRIETKKVISVENLSVKLVSNPQGYNQIDKRWVDKYKELWNIPDNLVYTLKSFTGELKPKNNAVRGKRRTFLNEMDVKTQNEVINFFKENKIKIITDILMGRGQFAARWMLVALILKDKSKWILKPMNEAMNVFGGGEIIITKLGSLKIGKITMQRKGGDAGRETANMLQFKINPCDLFKE